jgi:hypothetical protein
MLSILFTILILCLVGGLIFWAFQYLPIPQPFRNIVYFILIIIFVVILISIFFGGINVGDIGFHRKY